jgi:hypothetical protein
LRFLFGDSSLSDGYYLESKTLRYCDKEYSERKISAFSKEADWTDEGRPHSRQRRSYTRRNESVSLSWNLTKITNSVSFRALGIGATDEQAKELLEIHRKLHDGNYDPSIFEEVPSLSKSKVCSNTNIVI